MGFQKERMRRDEGSWDLKMLLVPSLRAKEFLACCFDVCC
jgi:hypothetical protein